MHLPPTTQTATAAQMTTSFEDSAEFPSPYLRATLMRLRIEMFSFAKSMQGELLDAFWKSIDELNTLRPTKK